MGSVCRVPRSRPGVRARPAFGRGASARLVAAAACALAAASLGCRKPPPASEDPAHKPNATAALSQTSAPAASAPAPTFDAPIATGVTTWNDLDDAKACVVRSADLEPNLWFGGLGVTAQNKELAVASVLGTQSKSDGLVAFSGVDTMTRMLARSHGLGGATRRAPRVFPNGDGAYTVVWFDRGGLVFTRTTFALVPTELSRVAGVSTDEADHTAIVHASSGALLAAAPVAPGEHAQLGLFLFAPHDPAKPPVTAIGATRHATSPAHPALAETPEGFLVAWEDSPPAGAGPVVFLTHFDANGREIGEQRVVSNRNHVARRPALISTPTGALLAWVDGGADGHQASVFARALDASGRETGPAYRVADGGGPSLAPLGTGGVLAFVSRREAFDEVVVTNVDALGKPATSGYVVSNAKKDRTVSPEPPALAVAADGRVAVAFAYGPQLRSFIKTFGSEPCFGLAGAPAASAPVPSAQPASSSVAP